MYEDEMNLDMDFDMDISVEPELSEQEIADILGVEYVTENDEIRGLEQEYEDPSLERLRKIRQNNYKKEQAKKAS